MEPIRGIILRRELPASLAFSPETARRLSESFVDNLSRLHGLDYAAIGLADLGKPQGYVERQVKGWTERYYGSQTHDLPEVAQISAWLQEHMPAPQEPPHIDNRHKHDKEDERGFPRGGHVHRRSEDHT